MATSDIIAIVLIIAVIIAVMGYFIIKSNEKSNRISSLMKEHSSLALILLNCEKLPPISSMTEEQTNIILSLSDSEWNEWESLHKRVQSLADKYPYVLYDFVNLSFPKCRDRVNYKKDVKLFSYIPQKIKAAVASLHLEELRLIDADSENVWKERDELRIFAKKISQRYPEGYKTYCIIHSDKLPKDSIVVNNKKQIAELQKLYDESIAYEGWEKKQEEFSSDFWQILKDVRSQDGRYTYYVSFKKPTRLGTLVNSEFKVWQGFCESYSPHLIDEQDVNFKARYDRISEFERKNRYFNESVYNQIVEIIFKFKEKMSQDLYVILIDESKRKWSKRTYDYHYKYIRERLNESDFSWFNYSDLPLVNETGNIGGIFILDLITSNEELKGNCKLIIEHFNKSVPLIGYYSMLKEYDVEELKELAKNNEGYLSTEKSDIEFIKNSLLQIRKHSFFSYLAIPNTLIGEASHSKETKEQWIDAPTNYLFKTKDEAGFITGEYSIDGGLSFKDISVEGDGFNIDETARFTYLLFKNMGVLSQFKKKGSKAIQFMNNHNFLAYH